jgi:hypothetical protein
MENDSGKPASDGQAKRCSAARSGDLAAQVPTGLGPDSAEGHSSWSPLIHGLCSHGREGATQPTSIRRESFKARQSARSLKRDRDRAITRPGAFPDSRVLQ